MELETKIEYRTINADQVCWLKNNIKKVILAARTEYVNDDCIVISAIKDILDSLNIACENKQALNNITANVLRGVRVKQDENE